MSDATNGSITIDGLLATFVRTDYYYGADEFTFQVSDGELTDNASVSLFVNSVNDAPIISSDALLSAYTLPGPSLNGQTYSYQIDCEYNKWNKCT